MLKRPRELPVANQILLRTRQRAVDMAAVERRFVRCNQYRLHGADCLFGELLALFKGAQGDREIGVVDLRGGGLTLNQPLRRNTAASATVNTTASTTAKAKVAAIPNCSSNPATTR